jgi:hypothetical protein
MYAINFFADSSATQAWMGDIKGLQLLLGRGVTE